MAQLDIRLKRAYEPADGSDGYRVLVVDPSVPPPVIRAAAGDEADEEVVERLRTWRLERSQEDGVPAYVVILDGSEPECEWKNDPRSKVPGTLPAELMPRITRDDYVTNSNDSYWLANPAAPLEGFSPIIGPERTERSLRTRAGLTLVREALEKDGKLSPAGIQQMLYSHRNYGAELLLDARQARMGKKCVPDGERPLQRSR